MGSCSRVVSELNPASSLVDFVTNRLHLNPCLLLLDIFSYVRRAHHIGRQIDLFAFALNNDLIELV